MFLCLYSFMFTTNKLTAEQEYAKFDQTAKHPTAGLNEAAVLSCLIFICGIFVYFYFIAYWAQL